MSTKMNMEISVFFSHTFKWMGFGVLLTAVVSWLMVSSGMAVALASSPLLLLLVIAELALVWYLSGNVHKMSAGTAKTLFLSYAGVNGLTLSTIFINYAKTDVTMAFLLASCMFFGAAISGLVMKTDVTGYGHIMAMALVGLIVAMVVNILLHSSILNWIVSLAGIVLFLALTVYDVQNIKKIGAGSGYSQKYAILGALDLYLNLINLLLFVLELFGSDDD